MNVMQCNVPMCTNEPLMCLSCNKTIFLGRCPLVKGLWVAPSKNVKPALEIWMGHKGPQDMPPFFRGQWQDGKDEQTDVNYGICDCYSADIYC